MAAAKLHIICGNCGSGEGFELELVPEEKLENEEVVNRETAYLWCKNCRTLHDLSDSAELKEKVNE